MYVDIQCSVVQWLESASPHILFRNLIQKNWHRDIQRSDSFIITAYSFRSRPEI